MSPGILTLIQGLIVGLVSYRLWRLWALDSILDGWRDSRVSVRTGKFLNCAWCAGTWTTVVVTAAIHLVWPLEIPILSGLVALVVVGLIGERS